MSKSYFARANSSAGLVNRFESNLRGLNKIYLLTGASCYVKSVFIGRVSAYFKEHGEELEYVFSPFSMKHYDGVILRDKGIAIIDENCVSDIRIDVNCIPVDLGSCISVDAASKIKILSAKADEEYKNVYEIYEKAKKIHDEWEKIYITNMNLSRLNSFNDFTISKLLSTEHMEGEGKLYERFFGCAYSDGHVNYIDKLTKDITKRYFIKGRPGTGKSTFMRRFASKAVSMGYDAEVYYCSFDPYSYDMVVIRDLSLCVFDSTAPHEKFPTRNTDEILDFYVHSGLDGVDEKCAEELAAVKKRYSSAMSRAGDIMKAAAELTEKTDSISAADLDFEKMNNLVYSFLNEIF
ncbi:MAG: hypothetical protein IJ460_04055 [Clostridia bacterium]|nr:hypothetical protein [Clostridia bacterium]